MKDATEKCLMSGAMNFDRDKITTTSYSEEKMLYQCKKLILGNQSMNPMEVLLWHLLHTHSLSAYQEESKTCHHKISAGKTEGRHGYKRQSSILPPSRALKQQPASHLCTFQLFLHLQVPVRPACSDAAWVAGASLCEHARSATFWLHSCSPPLYSHCCAKCAKMKHTPPWVWVT